MKRFFGFFRRHSFIAVMVVFSFIAVGAFLLKANAEQPNQEYGSSGEGFYLVSIDKPGDAAANQGTIRQAFRDFMKANPNLEVVSFEVKDRIETIKQQSHNTNYEVTYRTTVLMIYARRWYK